MSEMRADTVTVNIDETLKSFYSTPSKPSMFMVGDHLRSINRKAYEPEIIAIGPFHHHKSHLQNMQQHKLRYLNLLLDRRGESSVKRYVTTIRQLEDRARKCYAEDINLDEDEFVKMLILDGCFIIEFLYMLQYTNFRYKDDPIFQYEHIASQLLRDLTVFENQIPFFIIEGLFNMIKRNDGDDKKILIWPLLRNSIYPVRREDLRERPINGHHLLGIVRDIQCSFAMLSSQMDTGIQENVANINSAVELKEAGISFKKSEGNSLFHIDFKNKEMIIPEWEISDLTESLFRNLIAYESYLTSSSRRLVTDYVHFMNCLVHSPEDAKLLRLSGIISNFLGSDKMVFNVINKLGKNIIISNEFSYSYIFGKAKRHCDRPWNKWMAILRRDYFSSPWALISVLAAIILLLLAILQTIFAILSFCNDSKHLKLATMYGNSNYYLFRGRYRA